MNKKTLLTIVGLAAVFVIAVLAASNHKITQPNNELIFFYGNTCPHCLKAEQFLADNKVEEKIKIDKREVYQNKDNAELLGEKAHECGLDTANIGVPFLWDGSNAKCIVGDEPVISFFKNKIGQ